MKMKAKEQPAEKDGNYLLVGTAKENDYNVMHSTMFENQIKSIENSNANYAESIGERIKIKNEMLADTEKYFEELLFVKNQNSIGDMLTKYKSIDLLIAELIEEEEFILDICNQFGGISERVAVEKYLSRVRITKTVFKDSCQDSLNLINDEIVQTNNFLELLQKKRIDVHNTKNKFRFDSLKELDAQILFFTNEIKKLTAKVSQFHSEVKPFQYTLTKLKKDAWSIARTLKNDIKEHEKQKRDLEKSIISFYTVTKFLCNESLSIDGDSITEVIPTFEAGDYVI
jgi:hypothetical protein